MSMPVGESIGFDYDTVTRHRDVFVYPADGSTRIRIKNWTVALGDMERVPMAASYGLGEKSQDNSRMNEYSTIEEISDPYIIFRELFYRLRDSEYGSIFGIMWPGETRNNPKHTWYKSEGCLRVINEMINKLNNL